MNDIKIKRILDRFRFDLKIGFYEEDETECNSIQKRLDLLDELEKLMVKSK